MMINLSSLVVLESPLLHPPTKKVPQEPFEQEVLLFLSLSFIVVAA